MVCSLRVYGRFTSTELICSQRAGTSIVRGAPRVLLQALRIDLDGVGISQPGRHNECVDALLASDLLKFVHRIHNSSNHLFVTRVDIEYHEMTDDNNPAFRPCPCLRCVRRTTVMLTCT